MNKHADIRAFHGTIHASYKLQQVIDNVSLLRPEVLVKVNQLVVSTGHAVAKKKAWRNVGRDDSFVVETDVHYPTDFNLLLDSTRCLKPATELHHLKGWRQRR